MTVSGFADETEDGQGGFGPTMSVGRYLVFRSFERVELSLWFTSTGEE